MHRIKKPKRGPCINDYSDDKNFMHSIRRLKHGRRTLSNFGWSTIGKNSIAFACWIVNKSLPKSSIISSSLTKPI